MRERERWKDITPNNGRGDNQRERQKERYNKEREEKEKLFDDKVSELRKMFDKQNLDNLKNLKFDITSKKVEFEDEELTDAEPATN